MSTELTRSTANPTALGQPDAVRNLTFTPRVDIYETADELVLLADLPGVQPADLEVRFERGELTLHGRCGARQANAPYALAEYGVGDFYRAFTINEDIDADQIAAELKHGVLTVHLPKSEKAKPKKIAIKA
jgi:HSP20 family protein